MSNERIAIELSNARRLFYSNFFLDSAITNN
jgi:hypothetical protein